MGPLKCYKDNHHGHGTGGVYSSARPQGYGSGQGGGRAFDTINTRRDFNEARRVEEMRKEEAARKARENIRSGKSLAEKFNQPKEPKDTRTVGQILDDAFGGF